LIIETISFVIFPLLVSKSYLWSSSHRPGSRISLSLSPSFFSPSKQIKEIGREETYLLFDPSRKKTSLKFWGFLEDCLAVTMEVMWCEEVLWEEVVVGAKAWVGRDSEGICRVRSCREEAEEARGKGEMRKVGEHVRQGNERG
jgi:hypothetical protein